MLFRSVSQSRYTPGKPQYTDLEQLIVQTMNETGKQARAKQARTLLSFEIAEKAQRGWYIIFNTLTVNSENYSKVFHRDSDDFQNYIRTVDRLTCQAITGSKRRKPNNDYHTYFAVVEEGSQTGRLHIHVVHFLRKLPIKARDPNRGLRLPYKRELTCPCVFS